MFCAMCVSCVHVTQDVVMLLENFVAQSSKSAERLSMHCAVRPWLAQDSTKVLAVRVLREVLQDKALKGL